MHIVLASIEAGKGVFEAPQNRQNRILGSSTGCDFENFKPEAHAKFSKRSLLGSSRVDLAKIKISATPPP